MPQCNRATSAELNFTRGYSSCFLVSYLDDAPNARLTEAIEIRSLLRRNTEELSGVLRALNGEYILPEAGGDLLRDGPGVLPTGAPFAVGHCRIIQVQLQMEYAGEPSVTVDLTTGPIAVRTFSTIVL